MIVYLIMLFLLLIWHARTMNWNEDYCGRYQTTSIKGFFIILVFLSHAMSYCDKGDSIWDSIFFFLVGHIGQLMVVMFFFYSGYGIMESYKRKNDYQVSFIKQRVIKTWFHFALALIPFFILSFFTHRYTTHEYIMSLCGWTSIGNSNWYVFDILTLYIITFIAFQVQEIHSTSSKKWFIGTVCFFTLIMWILLKCFSNRGKYWYNTILTYPLGIMFSFYKENVEGLFRSNRSYYISLGVLIVIFVTLYIVSNDVSFSIRACIFALIIVLVTMKVYIGNKVLEWFGNHLFSIYILQRLPMIILDRYNLPNYLFLTLSLLSTAILAAIFSNLLVIVDKKIFQHKIA